MQYFPLTFNGAFVIQGIALWQLQRLDEAVECFENGLRSFPHELLLHSNLAFALQQLGRYGAAIQHYEQALSTAPNEPQALLNLPLLLSAAPQADLRDGARALEIAQRAVAASSGKSAEAYNALASAYAETGQFSEAVKAIESAQGAAFLEDELRQALRSRAALYRSGRPFRLR